MPAVKPQPNAPIPFSIGQVRLRADGIVEIEINADVAMDIAGANDLVAAQEGLAQGRKYPTLVKMGKMKSISREARQRVGAGSTADIMSAVALVTYSPISRMIGNLMSGFTKSLYPTKLFATEEDAVAWLLEREKNKSA